MSAIEIKEKLQAIIDRHASNYHWLARVFEILQSGEPEVEGGWWKNLSDEQKRRIDESILAVDKREFISNEDVLGSL